MYKIKINRKKHTIKVQHVTRRVIIRGKAKRGLPGVGIPTGGTTNQILAKKSNANYDTEWRDEQAALVRSVNGKVGDVVITKSDVGLANVDNTSDANKPISTATQTALNTKANDSAVVHKTGNESISGIKTFADSPVVPTPTTATQAANKQYVDDAISGIPDELVFNVKDYGAVGNNTADDTVAFQATIDAAHDAGGGVVFIPAGQYVIDPTTGLDLHNSTSMIGTGAKSVLMVKAGVNVLNNIVKVESVSDVYLANFAIDGQRSTLSSNPNLSTNYGIYVANSSGTRVVNVKVSFTTGVGIHIYASSNVVVRDCYSTNNRYHGFELEQTTGCQLINCAGVANQRHGVFISPGEVGGTGAYGNIISGNDFSYNSQYGVAYGIDAAGGSIGLTRDNILSDNTITYNSHYGVSVYRVDDVDIKDNLIAYNGYIGLYLYRAERNTVTNNRFHNNSQSGNGQYDEILLEGAGDGQASQHNLITDNHILIDGDIKANYAIREATANDGPNVVKNNLVINAGVSGRIRVQHVNTSYEFISDTPVGNEMSLRAFNDGVVISPDATLPGGVMGIDAPFGNAALRMFSDVGNLQFVAPNGNADWYLGGNNVFSVTDEYVTVHNYQIKEVATPTAGTDAANKNYVDAAVSGVPVGNFVLKAGDTMSGPLNIDATDSDDVLPLGRAGAINTGLSIHSSFDGGEDNGVGTDSTGRLNLYSYQRAQTGSFGETIRHFLMRSDAKAMNAWYMPKAGYNPDETPDTSEGWSPVWWIGAHWEANDNNSIHGHGSIEVPDLTGAVQTRLEVPFIDQENPPEPGEPIGIDITNIRTNLADFSVRASSGVLRIGGQNQYNKDLLFSLDSSRNAQYERWKVRANNTTETGSNVGTDFQINRYSDTGSFLESAFFIKRSNGRVGIKNTSPSAQLHVTSASGIILRLDSTDTSSLSGMLLMETANATRRAFQAQVAGDTIARFSFETSGLIEWGAGGGTARDTNLYRAGASHLKTDDAFTIGGQLDVQNNKVVNLATPTVGTDGANKSYVDTSIAALVDSAPGTLDTLNELAAALGDDPNFATTMTTLIGTKANDADVLHKTGNETATGIKTLANVVLNGTSGDLLTINGVGTANSIIRFQDDGVEKGALFLLNGGTSMTLRSQSSIALTWDNGTAAKTITLSSSTVNVPDAINIVLGTTTGTKIGTSASQKLGFYNATPVIQPVLATDFTYTVSNGTTDRTFDADALTMDEIADVLGTLSGDLVAVKTALKSLGLLA